MEIVDILILCVAFINMFISLGEFNEQAVLGWLSTILFYVLILIQKKKIDEYVNILTDANIPLP